LDRCSSIALSSGLKAFASLNREIARSNDMALRPEDKAIELHLSRSQTYLLRPPAPDWDGVHVMTMK
ncbi:MAG: hypothetical protein AAFO84_05995, partial [Cyanobacteria bacterium J06598_1]